MEDENNDQPIDPDVEEKKSRLLEIESASWRRFDETMIALSAGALGLSMIFVKNIAPHPQYRYFIAIAWCLFGLTLVVMTFSFMISILALREEQEFLDEKKNNPDVDLPENVADKILNVMNWGSLISFTLGVISLAMFAICNLPK